MKVEKNSLFHVSHQHFMLYVSSEGSGLFCSWYFSWGEPRQYFAVSVITAQILRIKGFRHFFYLLTNNKHTLKLTCSRKCFLVPSHNIWLGGKESVLKKRTSQFTLIFLGILHLFIFFRLGSSLQEGYLVAWVCREEGRSCWMGQKIRVRRHGWGNWRCSVWRKEGWEETSSVSTAIWKEVVATTDVGLRG